MLSEPEKLQYAMRDIAYRSRISAFLYLVIFAIVIAATPFYSDHTAFVSSIGVILFIGTLLRGSAVWNFAAFFPKKPNLWVVLNETAIYLQAGAWGVLSIMSIQYYGWQWTSMVICLCSAAFAAGAVITCSTSLRVVILYLSLLFIPTLAGLLFRSAQDNSMALLFLTYMVFLLFAAKRLNKEYWHAVNNTLLLKQRAKQLEAKNIDLESFTYSVSHDLRSPLRSIDGFSNMLLEDAWDKLNDQERDYLRRVRMAAQKMGGLIDDLLQLSRVSRAGYEPKTVNLTEMVTVNFEKLKQLDPNRDVELEIEPNLQVTGDQSLLDIAVCNLVGNAWKYSSKRPHAKIRFATQMRDGYTVYYIKDNGVGFDTRYNEKLFGPFQRLHSDDEFPGSGIGLATVHRIIDRHGGDIWANAKVDRGATFYFTIHHKIH